MLNLQKPTLSKIPQSVLLIGLGLSVGAATAQHGITPSTGGMFFDDARARAIDIEQPAGNGSGSSYQFHRGYYRTLGPDGSADLQADQDPYASLDGAGDPMAGVDNYSHSQRYGREFGRYSGATHGRGNFFAPAYVTDPFSTGRHNFKLGPIPFRLSAGVNAEYNDNITRRSSDELEEYIVGFDLGVHASYNLTRYNRISVSAGFGIDHYFDHPEVNPQDDEEFSLSIADGSSIHFDVLLGDTLITFYDRFSISRLTTDDFALDDLDIFSQFNNQAGVVANWAINPYAYLTLSYNRGDQIAIDDEYSYLDQGSNSVLASLGWSPNQIWTAGVNVSTTWVDYDEQVQNDAEVYNVGLFFSSPVSHNTSIRLGGGTQIFEFDEGGSNGDVNDLDDYYYNIALQNQLNARVSHSLSFGHESSLGSRSNFVTTDYVRYGVGVIGYRGSRMSASVFYEWEDASGGIQREDFERYGIDLYWGHQITDWMHLGLGYHYGDTDSSLDERDYTQHSFSIDTSYPIREDTSLALGYRFWTVDADGEESDFDQNRVVMSLRYHF